MVYMAHYIYNYHEASYHNCKDLRCNIMCAVQPPCIKFKLYEYMFNCVGRIVVVQVIILHWNFTTMSTTV